VGGEHGPFFPFCLSFLKPLVITDSFFVSFSLSLKSSNPRKGQAGAGGVATGCL